MRRLSTILTVVALTLGAAPSPSGAAPGPDRSSPSREDLEQRALAKLTGRSIPSETDRAAQGPGEGPTGRAPKASGPSGGSPAPEATDPGDDGEEARTATGESAKFDPGAGSERVPGEWIVAFEPFGDPDQADALARTFGGQAEERFRVVFEGFVFKGPAEAARRLSEHPRIRKVTANGVVEATAESVPTGVRRIQADDATAAGAKGAGQKVAILDTGIDLDHPDLRANIDTAGAKNFVGRGNSADDNNGHGTHVAGIVAAASNGSGVVGVAPSAKVVPVKVLGSDGKGSFSNVILGIDHVIARGDIQVINMSLSGSGGDGSCSDGFLREAICEAVDRGIVVVVAAGNSNINAGSTIPARYEEVIAVSALNDGNGEPGGDSFASFSNDGSVVDLIAPGVGINSTTRGGGYGAKNGTSMAAPHVAGAAALARADGVSAGGVLARLQSTGECPNTSVAGNDRNCSNAGRWSGDDTTAEPLVNALRAAGEQGPGGGGGGVVGTAPTLSVSAPANNTTVTGTVTVVAKAGDAEDGNNVTVRYVVGSASGTLSPKKKGNFEGAWNTTSVADGARTLTVTATDRDGNATTRSIPVTVSNDGGSGAEDPADPEDPLDPVDPGPGGSPVVTLLQPGDGTTVDGKQVSINARATDDDPAGSLTVEYQIDSGAWVAMAYRSSTGDYLGTWNSRSVSDGNHTVRVRAVDSDGNPTISQPITVTVSN